MLLANERSFLQLNGRTGLSILGLFFGVIITAMTTSDWILWAPAACKPLVSGACSNYTGQPAWLFVLLLAGVILTVTSLVGLVWNILTAPRGKDVLQVPSEAELSPVF
jgi:hypothetical protein